MSTLLLRLKTWWETADKTQKVITLGGTGFVLVMLLGIFFYASSPKFALLYSGLSDADKNQVVGEIQAMGIPVHYDSPGVVEVPQNKLQDVRMRLAGSGKLPKTSTYAGLAELDKINLMTTPAQEKERLKTALEGELAKSIESLEGVQSVRVHITLPESTSFVDNRRAPTAAVTVAEAAGKSLNPSQGKAIAALVANSCDGMDIKDVTVLNQRMDFIYNGRDAASNQTAAATKQTLEDKFAKDREVQLQRNLDRVFGPGMTLVTVRAELNMDKTNQKVIEEKPTLPKPLVDTQATETMTNAGVAPLAAAGTASNGQVTQPGSGASASKPSDYKNERKNYTIPMTRTESQVDRATGELKSLTINVIANSAPTIDPGDGTQVPNILADGQPGQTKLQEFLAGEVAALQKRDPNAFPDPKVTFVQFDNSQNKKVAEAEKAMAGQQRTQQIMSMLPIGALLLIGFVVMKQVGKMTKADRSIVIHTAGGGAHHDPAHPTSTAHSHDGTAAANTAAGFESAPEVTAGAFETGYEQIAMALPDLIVDPIPAKVSVPLEQIKKMAKDRPEQVATLIKSMILEEKR